MWREGVEVELTTWRQRVKEVSQRQGYESGQVHEEEKQVSRTEVWRRPLCCQPVGCFHKESTMARFHLKLATPPLILQKWRHKAELALLKEFSTLGFIKICAATS